MTVKMRHRDKLKAIAKELDKETVKLKAQVLPTRKRIAETKSKIQEKRLKLASVSNIIHTVQPWVKFNVRYIYIYIYNKAHWLSFWCWEKVQLTLKFYYLCRPEIKTCNLHLKLLLVSGDIIMCNSKEQVCWYLEIRRITKQRFRRFTSWTWCIKSAIAWWNSKF